MISEEIQKCSVILGVETRVDRPEAPHTQAGVQSEVQQLVCTTTRSWRRVQGAGRSWRQSAPEGGARHVGQHQLSEAQGGNECTSAIHQVSLSSHRSVQVKCGL